MTEKTGVALREEEVGRVRQSVRRTSFVFANKGNDRGKEGALENWLAWSTVWIAAKDGNEVRLKRLLESDASLANVKNVKNETALHFAASNGHVQCLAMLVEIGAESCVSDYGKAPVELACEKGHVECVKYLLKRRHIGSDLNTCMSMLSIATSRSDFATMAVLQNHMDSNMQLVDNEEERLSMKEERRLLEEEKIAKEADSIKISAIIIPPLPLPALGHPSTWTAKDVERWALELCPDAEHSLFLGAFSRYHLFGEVLMCFTGVEMRNILQRIGVPPPFRNRLACSFESFEGAPKIFDFAEFRKLPIAVGNAAAFRVIGFTKAAMNTPLQTARHFVESKSQLNSPIPKPFLFASMRDGLQVKKDKEDSTIVSHLGFILLVQPPDQQNQG